VPEDFTEIRYEVADRVATITLHRPDQLNAFTVTMLRELVAAFDAADADDDVRAVIVTGAGPSAPAPTWRPEPRRSTIVRPARSGQGCPATEVASSRCASSSAPNQ
jgi:hypothetical protein